MISINKGSNDIWFSSDWHLDHKNILRYDNRPFSDIGHMNYEFVKAYNSVVKSNDSFFFLGDITCGGRDKVIEHALANMKGRKFFIKGNHDTPYIVKLYEKYGTYLGYANEIYIDGQLICLSHYSHRVWNKSHRGSYHLYGHSHYNLENQAWGKSMDVGIMTSYNVYGNWLPLNYHTQIKPVLDDREILILDHHAPDM